MLFVLMFLSEAVEMKISRRATKKTNKCLHSELIGRPPFLSAQCSFCPYMGVDYVLTSHLLLCGANVSDVSVWDGVKQSS